MSNNNNAAMEHFCKGAKLMFPELNVRITDITHPTEAFLTRTLIHCLRAFGYRVEPPYSLEGEAGDSSKEKRIFLSKLCRQVQHILQISFPGKTYTYYDIIEPTAKKTLNTLDVLFNYYCFYKMHKKEVIVPIMEKHKERQALIAAIAAKRRELEQRKQKGAQDKIDMAKCEANIKKLREEIPKAEIELKEKSKVLRKLQSELAIEEERQSEIQKQLNDLKQRVVLDSDVAVVKMEAKQLKAQIENYKPEMAKQEQIFKDRRREIDSIAKLSEELDKAFTILPPEVVKEYKENLKQKDYSEKLHNVLVNKHQNLLDAQVKNHKMLEQQEAKYKARKLQLEQESSVEQRKIAAQKELINKQTAEVENLMQLNETLQQQIDEEQQAADNLKDYVDQLFGDHEVLS